MYISILFWFEWFRFLISFIFSVSERNLFLLRNASVPLLCQNQIPSPQPRRYVDSPFRNLQKSRSLSRVAIQLMRLHFVDPDLSRVL